MAMGMVVQQQNSRTNTRTHTHTHTPNNVSQKSFKFKFFFFQIFDDMLDDETEWNFKKIYLIFVCFKKRYIDI